jgi:hypothetical protein
MERLILDKQNFENIKGMMESKDTENLKVAMQVIENCDRKQSLVFLLMLKKAINIKAEDWKTHAPSTYNYFKQIGVNPDVPLTYSELLSALTRNKVPMSHIQYYLDDFCSYIFGSIEKMGYDFIAGVEVKLKLKDGYKVDE